MQKIALKNEKAQGINETFEGLSIMATILFIE